MSGINANAYERLNASFGKIANDTSFEDNNVIVMRGRDASKPGGLASLKIGAADYKGNLFRTAAQSAANKDVRGTFLRAVIDVFGSKGKIPKSVREAMDLDGDFGGDRPLKTRHIRATMSAIGKYIKRGMFEELDRLTHGKHNLGQLTLDDDGNVKAINSHHIRFLRNFSSTTPEENRKVREKVSAILWKEFGASGKGPAARVIKFRMQELFNTANQDSPLVRADVGRLIDDLKSLKTASGAVDTMLGVLSRMRSAQGKYVSLGDDVRLSARKPTPEENRATRLFLYNLLGTETESANGSCVGCNPIVSAVRMILVKDLAKEITCDDVVRLLKEVQQSRRNSSKSQREIEERTEGIKNDLRDNLTKLCKEYGGGAGDDFVEATMAGFEELCSDFQDEAFEESGKDPKVALEQIKSWVEARMQQEMELRHLEGLKKKRNQIKAGKAAGGNQGKALGDQIKKLEEAQKKRETEISNLEKEFEECGLNIKNIFQPPGAHPDFHKKHPDFQKRVLVLFESALEAQKAFRDDAELRVLWNLQKRRSDELLKEYKVFDDYDVSSSLQKDDALRETFDKVSVLKRRLSENEDKINDLNAKIEKLKQELKSLDSKDRTAWKLDSDAYKFFHPKDAKQVDWTTVRYSGTNPVVKDMLDRLAEEDDYDFDLALEQLEGRVVGRKARSALMVEIKKSTDGLKKLKRTLADEVDARDYIQRLYDEDVDWKVVKYSGKNRVITSQLKALAEADEGGVKKRVRKALIELRNRIDADRLKSQTEEAGIDELKNQLMELDGGIVDLYYGALPSFNQRKLLFELEKEVAERKAKSLALREDLTAQTARQNMREDALGGMGNDKFNDLILLNKTSREWIASWDENMKFQWQ